MADTLTPLQNYGLWAMAGTFAVLFVFLGLRGRVPIDKGWGGMTIRRFGTVQRLCHWALALSFLVLAATGLAQLYGALLLSMIGTDTLAKFLALGRPLHTGAGIVFIASLAVSFLVWVRHSILAPRDAVWLAKAGGMLIKGTTAPAAKFNAGQKIFFWLIVLGGIGLSATGIALLLPYRTGLVSKTFTILAALGLHLPTDGTNLTPVQEATYARLWHGALAVGLACAVMVHVYLRTLGIQGAFSAMTSGRVDINMARQQHSLWAEREIARMEEEAFGSASAPRATPAE